MISSAVAMRSSASSSVIFFPRCASTRITKASSSLIAATSLLGFESESFFEAASSFLGLKVRGRPVGCCWVAL